MKYYPDSQVELQGFAAKHYDTVLNTMSFGLYGGFINKAIKYMDIKPDDKILDLGAGTGRNAMLMSKYLSDKGKIVGLEISDEMIQQFEDKFKDTPNISVINKRIDKPFDMGEKFDKVFISFVIHGFPHEVRSEVIKNAFNNLREGGEFIILDFNEFIVKEMPFLYRKIFTTFECKYAFDFVERNWKEILSEYGFGDFEEKTFFKKYVRLLKAKKIKN